MPRFKAILLTLLVLSATGAVYLPALPYPFAWDDIPVVRENPWLRGPVSPLRFFDPDFWRYQLPLARNDYRPLQMLALSAVGRLGGPSPAAYRLANFIVHLIAGWLAWRLARDGCGLGRPAAAAAAALFVLHPIQVESVVNPRNLAELIVCVFSLASILAFLSSFGPERRSLKIGLCSIFFLAAVLTKESALILPLILVFFSLSGGKKAAAGRVAATIPVWVIAGAFGLFKFLMMSGTDILRRPAAGIGALEAAGLGGYYLRLLTLPAGLNPLHTFSPPVRGLTAVWAAAAAAAATTVILAIRAWGRNRFIALPGIIFLLTLLPSLSKIVQTGRVVAEQRMYLPSVFLLLFLAGLAERTLADSGRRARKAVIGLTAATAALFALGAGTYVRAWRTPLSLWERAVSRAPGSALARNNLAAVLYEMGDSEAARSQLKAALAIDPSNSEALNNLGVYYRHRGNLSRAEELFRRSWSADANYQPAALNLAEALMQKRRFDRAEVEVRKFLERAPRSAEAHNVLGVALEQQGRAEEAADAYAAAAELDPFFAAPTRNIAGLLQDEGRHEESRKWARETVKRQPTGASGWTLLARSYIVAGDYEAAAEIISEGLREIPGDPGLESFLWAIRSMDRRPQ